MFERFTDRSRRVVVLAQEEARLLSHGWIGTEHILLGLLSEREGVAARVLEKLGISLDAVRSKVELIIGEGQGAPGGHIPFTPRAKKVLELSLREALQLGHNYIGTEHILLGLIREGEGVAAQVLVNMGAELSTVRHEVIEQLGGVRGGRVQPMQAHLAGIRPRETPAAAKAGVEARRLAGGSAVGSQHYLLGLLREEDSMAAKALAQLGVTRDDIEAKLAELEPTGTSDETPEQAGARRIAMRVEGRLIMLEIDDPELAESLEKAMVGRKVRIIRGSEPEAEAAGFPNVWSAVSRSVEDLTRRLGRVSFTAGRGSSAAATEWRPPGWHEGGHAAVYWVVNAADGPAGRLEVVDAEGERDAVRTWLGAWFAENRGGLAGGRPGGEAPTCCALWAYVDRAGDGFRMTSFGFGPVAPAQSTPAPLDLLVQAAIADLGGAA
jgi:ATP-dependent Clp protease ATP-binding subunit ClpA